MTAPVQYGRRIGAFVLYLLHGQLLPEKRVATLMADLFGVRLATATIARISQDCAERFQSFADAVRSHVVAAAVKHPRFRGGWLWTKPASALTARRSGCMSLEPRCSPSTASRPGVAARWRRSAASWCTTTGIPTTG